MADTLILSVRADIASGVSRPQINRQRSLPDLPAGRDNPPGE